MEMINWKVYHQAKESLDSLPLCRGEERQISEAAALQFNQTMLEINKLAYGLRMMAEKAKAKFKAE